MLKKIKYIILITTLSLLAYGAFVIFTTPKQLLPLPYAMKYAINEDEITKAQSSDILVIGDSMGVALDPYLPEIIEKASLKLRNPLTIYNWSKEHEGLHRTLFKLRSLKRWPKLIIYFGASEEAYELKFNPNDYAQIKKNFENYKDKKILSAIMTFPWLSKLIYKKVQTIPLSQTPKAFSRDLNFLVGQRINELTFALFQMEFDYLLTMAREHNSKFLAITPPIKLDIAPKEVCENAQSNSVIIEQNDIKNLISAGQDKDAYARASELLLVTKGNAYSHYLVGLSAYNLGNFPKARSELTFASAFDCKVWRAHPVLNSIIRKSVEHESVRLIDFDETMALLLGRDALFFDDLTPQHIYYKDLQRTLLLQIKEIFKL